MPGRKECYWQMERKGSEKCKRAYYIATAAVCLCVFGVVYVLNRMTPLHDDDYHFCFVFYDLMPVAFDRRVASLADILLSVRNYYLLSGGRALSHFFVYLMLFIGKRFFNAVNSLMFVALGLLITFCVRPAHGRRTPSTALLAAAVYAALWLFLPMVGETVFWLSGAVNYLWMACLDLAFLLCYINYRRNPIPAKNGALKAVLMLPFGILAGATNENSGGAVLLILLAYFIMCKKYKIRIPAWAYTGVVGLTVGIAALVFAPGNLNRSVSVEQGRALVGLSNAGVKLVYILGFIKQRVVYLILAIVLLMLLTILIGRGNVQKRGLNLSLVFLGAGLASMLVLTVTPEYLDRPFFFGTVLIVLAALYAGDYLIHCARQGGKAAGRAASLTCTAGAALIGALTVISVIMAFGEFDATSDFYDYQDYSLSDAAANGNSWAAIEMRDCENSTYSINHRVKNIGASPDDYSNRWLARYYGLDKVYWIGSDYEGTLTERE